MFNTRFSLSHLAALRTLLLVSAIALSMLLLAGDAHAQIIIDQNTTVGPDDKSLYNQDVIVRGATLTIDGVHQLASLTVERNASNQPGVVTHSFGFSNRDVNGVWLTVSGNVFVQGLDDKLELVASRIDANGRGYGVQQGPGAGTGSGSTGSGAGGGHGGAGSPGTHSSSVGGSTYGSFSFPTTMGSGGGPSSGSGAGGGVLRLTVEGTLTVDGAITADGAMASTSSATGGGAGGSVWIDCGTLAGAGVISASGGSSNNSTAGSGGGGRVAVYADASSFNDENFHAWGGSGTRLGGAGTVYYRPALGEPATLIIDNGEQAKVVAITEMSGEVVIPENLLVRNDGHLGAPVGDDSLHLIVYGNATVEVDGRIEMNGRGYGVQQGPGAGTGSGSTGSGAGGGHGGAGSPGTHSSSVGGSTYGSFSFPTTMGSGGGSNSGSGAGGGVLRLTVEGTLTVDGAITADGAMASTASATGGGAGGSVWIDCGTLAGAGVISASGGSSNNSTAGSGGGGRVAVYSCNMQMSPSQVLADTNTPRPGEPGTVFFFADSIDLLEQPQSQVVDSGESVAFTVAADGDGELTYQWRYNGVFIDDDEHFSGTDTATLTISNVTCVGHAGEYEAVVTDSCGFVFSQPAALHVIVTADFNNDCIVDVLDLLILLGAWGPCPKVGPCPADLNNSGTVDVQDLLILLSNWG